MSGKMLNAFLQTGALMFGSGLIGAQFGALVGCGVFLVGWALMPVTEERS